MSHHFYHSRFPGKREVPCQQYSYAPLLGPLAARGSHDDEIDKEFRISHDCFSFSWLLNSPPPAGMLWLCRSFGLGSICSQRLHTKHQGGSPKQLSRSSTQLYQISLLSGYGNLDNQCRDPMNNNKDCRVGQLTNNRSYMSSLSVGSSKCYACLEGQQQGSVRI